MKTQNNVDVNVGISYTGQKSMKNALKDMGSLGQAAVKLGGIIGATFATQKIIAFGKEAVTAFAADEKSAKILSNTLGNLGIAFDNVPVESFITKLSELNGIAKTDLRTSFDTLVRSTGDATKAQDLLSLGLDVSAGTGKDLATVTVALAKAYGGNFAAISKLGAGITKAEIASGNFSAIQEHLTKVFKGDAATAADTFSGKIARIKTSFEELKITIGSGIVDALTYATNGGGSVDKLQSAMTSISSNIADSVRGLGVMVELIGQAGSAVGKSTGFNFKQFFSDIGSAFGFAFGTTELKNLGKNAATKAALAGAAGSTIGEYQNTAANNARAAATAKNNAANLAAQKAITDQKKKQLELDRAALSLKLAGNTTDMQNIEIQAALQRGQSEQVTNVLLLQRAIITGNADQANILSQEVLKANGKVMDVNGNIINLAGAKDPFADWPTATKAAQDQLKAIQDALAAITSKTITVTVNTVSTGSNGVASLIPTVTDTSTLAAISGGGASTLGDYLAGVANNGMYAQPGSGVSTIGDYLSKTNNNGLYAQPGNGASTIGDYNSGVNVTVVLNGQAVGNAITSAQVDASASGIPSSFQRSGFGSGALPW